MGRSTLVSPNVSLTIQEDQIRRNIYLQSSRCFWATKYNHNFETVWLIIPCWGCWRRQHTWQPSGRRQHRSARNGNPTRSRWVGRKSSPGKSWSLDATNDFRWNLRMHITPGWCCLSLGWYPPQWEWFQIASLLRCLARRLHTGATLRLGWNNQNFVYKV